jgi:Zn-dependent peptidase ImmA (M78 family)
VADFNRELLILAREYRCWTQTELAHEVSFSQAEISKFETGIKIPTDSQARVLAARLKFPLEFFYTSDSVRDFGSGCVYNRRRKTASETKLKQLLALVNLKRMQLKRLLNSVQSCAQFSFEPLDLDEFQGNPANVAKAQRAIWKLPPGPVQNVVNVIENAGGIIVSCDFGTDKIDALSQWLPGMVPVFLVNKRIPTDRLRWTLTHEIGHIVMHRFPTDKMEIEADQFAAEFLLPEREIKPALSNLSLAKLASLKPYWRVSMNALLRRASDLETISPRNKSYLWMQMGQRGYRTHEPVDIPPEKPTILEELLAFHRDKLGFGIRDMAKTMLMDEGEFISEYLHVAEGVFVPTGSNHRTLRLVDM